MNKSIAYTYGGANQDITKSKHTNQYYFEAQHVKIVATSDQSTGSLTNEKGTEAVITLPNITINRTFNTISYNVPGEVSATTKTYTNGTEIDTDTSIPTSSTTQKIIGNVTTRTGFVLFTTDDAGMDCIWEANGIVDGDYTLELKYLRNLEFSTSNPIQAIYNYENENIQKVYWVDGNNQIRHINLRYESIEGNGKLLDLEETSLNFVGKVTFSQPYISSVLSGGNHTAGMIQYAYNLYKLNSSQTKISPLSELIPLGNQEGGGEVNETVDDVPVVKIDNIDTSYDYIKVYAIKYTTFNTTPSVSLIEETEISGSSLTVYDTGAVEDTLTLEEFLFLGSDPIVPQHIASKDNRLFPSNIKTKPFILPETLDTRAYCFDNTPTAIVKDNITLNSANLPIGPSYTINTSSWSLDKNNDAVNPAFDTYKYQSDGSTLGAEGKYIKVEIVTNSSTADPDSDRFFKDREIYRIGIEFYNNLGQTSLPSWIVDYKMPSGNLEGDYNTLKVELKAAFATDFLNISYDDSSQKPVGYRVLVAKRGESDKTILSQGILTPMMFQVLGDEATDFNQFTSTSVRQNFQDSELKMPSFLTRNFQKIPNTASNDNNGVLLDTRHLAWLNDDPNDNQDEGGEIYTTTNSENKISQTFQHSKMMQMYSPEVLFGLSSNVSAGTKLVPIGVCQNTLNGVLAEERRVDTQEVRANGKTESGLNPARVNSSNYIIDNGFLEMFSTPESDFLPPFSTDYNNHYAFIGLPGAPPGEESMNFYQYYRQFNTFEEANTKTPYSIYKSPEIATRGADAQFYGNDAKFKYVNNLLPFTSDGEDDCATCELVASINSFNSRCVTLVLGSDGADTTTRPSLETLYASTGLSTPDSVLMGEITRESFYPYTGSMYGGHTYEDKKRTNYVGVGSYTPTTTTFVQIDSPGDTYVQSFRFLRIHKTDTEVYDVNQLQISEVVEYTTETTVDLLHRNDLSFSGWDSRFQPQETEFHKYNTVYSQQPDLVTTEDTPFTFRRVDNFDTRIQSTKLKIPNETIDSWTDILVNETLDLNGKFGPINNLIEYNDELYSFQDEAVARILINPNVQIQASDNIGIELGTGNVLYDYKYLTTRSGSVNKWGIVSGKRGIYYYDALNKGIGRLPASEPYSASVLLSDVKGMHTYFNNNYDYSMLKIDNPILESGVIAGADNYNNDIYFTLHQGDLSFTRCFNELRDEFVDLKTYTPTSYIYKGERLFGIATDNKVIHEHGKGDYNSYYGSIEPSYITLLVNPESEMDTIINNIQYASEVYLNNIDQPTKTLTHIQAYNEYQDSGRVALVNRRDANLRRKFREWRANVPRHNNGRQRIRNPWVFLKLEFSNSSNYKLILHDMIVRYTV